MAQVLLPDAGGSTAGTSDAHSWEDYYHAYVGELWDDGYQFGDIFKSIGRGINPFWFAGHTDEQLQDMYGYLFEPDAEEMFQNGISNILENDSSISDATTAGKVSNMSSEELFRWLIQNDPDNARGWIEQLAGVMTERENTQSARDYEQYVAKNKMGWLRQGLEDAGINPILAYQYLGNNNSNVGTAGYPDSSVSTNAISRENSIRNESAANKRANASIMAALIALIGIYLKKSL